jgi:environmental stress-induced protein Ves
MNNLHRFQRADLAAQQWKNGGGVTKEILSWPPGSTVANFNWRVSIAHIANNGPFSTFPGVDRVITLLEGAGVTLRSADGRVNHRLDQALLPFAFKGEAPVQADLLGPDCHDFNVMTRRSACSPRVQVLKSRALLPLQSQGLLFATHGQWRANDQTLVANEGLWWHDEPFAWTLTPQSKDTALIAVLIQPTQ